MTSHWLVQEIVEVQSLNLRVLFAIAKSKLCIILKLRTSSSRGTIVRLIYATLFFILTSLIHVLCLQWSRRYVTDRFATAGPI